MTPGGQSDPFLLVGSPPAGCVLGGKRARAREQQPPIYRCVFFRSSSVVKLVKAALQVGHVHATFSVSPMEELAEAQQTNDPKEVPPSHRSYHVWTTHRLGLDLSTAVLVLETFLPKAKKLVERESTGGTDASLGLVMFCLVPQVLHSSSAADAQEAQVSQDAQMHLSTYVAAQHATIFSFHIVLVFNGMGRKKDKVKRSLESFWKYSAKAKEGVQLVLSQQDQFTTNTPDQFATTMHRFLEGIHSATFENALALLRASAQRRCLWPHDNERDPTE